jgi:hypothetical protein
MPDRQPAASRPAPACPLCKQGETVRPLPATMVATGVQYWQRVGCGAIWATKDAERAKDAWRGDN